MAKTTKKAAKKTNPKPRAASSADSVSKLKKTIAAQGREIREAAEQQAATSDILRMIASSPSDLQLVLDTIAESAARLCSADDALVWRVSGNVLVLAAHFGPIPTVVTEGSGHVIDRDTPAGRAVVDRQTIHVHDLVKAAIDFPRATTRGIAVGVRTALAAPLLHEGNVIGVIHIRRTEVWPFADRHIKLLETFADQAVIAIENARLIDEQQSRNRELTEALEQQTATSEVLRVIASSPTELQPVLDTLIANAVRLSGATRGHVRQYESEFYRVVAHYGETPEMIATLRANPLPASPELPAARALLGGKPVHILDVQAETGVHLNLVRQMGTRTLLAVPLLREGANIGSLTIWRDFVEPFTERQIELVKTFSDQAVIAIENVRLFQELKESLEQQTATSEILGVIASSPTDLQPVLDTITECAARVCGAEDAAMRLVDGNVLRLAAHYGPVPDVALERPIDRHNPGGRAVVDREIIHVENMHDQVAKEFPGIVDTHSRTAVGTVLAVPLMREGNAIGAIHIRRKQVQPFTNKEIALLKTFADQAVIAIENVRLFKESASAMRNCVKPWSIRPQRPRCSASSAARLLTCSRCSTLSSRAPPGFVESMTWRCDSAKET